jgi:hypothetical protein
MATFISVMMAVNSSWVDMPIWSGVSLVQRNIETIIPERLASSRTASVVRCPLLSISYGAMRCSCVAYIDDSPSDTQET